MKHNIHQEIYIRTQTVRSGFPWIYLFILFKSSFYPVISKSLHLWYHAQRDQSRLTLWKLKTNRNSLKYPWTSNFSRIFFFRTGGRPKCLLEFWHLGSLIFMQVGGWSGETRDHWTWGPREALGIHAAAKSRWGSYPGVYEGLSRGTGKVGTPLVLSPGWFLLAEAFFTLNNSYTWAKPQTARETEYRIWREGSKPPEAPPKLRAGCAPARYTPP